MNTPDLPFRVSDVAANTSQSLPKASVLQESKKRNARLDLLIDTNRVNGNKVSIYDMTNLWMKLASLPKPVVGTKP